MKQHLVYITLFLAYCALVAIPGEWLWYAPSTPQFAEAAFGEMPKLTFERDVKRRTTIKYSGVVRDALTHEVVCEGGGGPFPYQPQTGPVIGQTLAWWIPSDPRCRRLAVGIYWVETTWVITRPLGDLLPPVLSGLFGWIIPPKDVSRISPPFSITAPILTGRSK